MKSSIAAPQGTLTIVAKFHNNLPDELKSDADDNVFEEDSRQYSMTKIFMKSLNLRSIHLTIALKKWQTKEHLPKTIVRMVINNKLKSNTCLVAQTIH